ncbi:MAG: serine protein kinase PrkA [Candidatus Aminicenantes bacterium]|nr:serine protein kinase PrkA [Candidatus Aminicenantes bacterium]
MVKETIKNAVTKLNRDMEAREKLKPVHFEKFLALLAENPRAMIRSVFQVFHDMMVHYVGEGFDEYPDDPESIGFVFYDCTSLLAEGTDRPFFADRLFANRLVNLAKALRQGAQQNKIYIFEGPPGCGKSTFLNNLLQKFEIYANTEAGLRYETVWRLDRKSLGAVLEDETIPVFESMNEGDEDFAKAGPFQRRFAFIRETDDYVEIPCPSHDNPILMIPKSSRRELFDTLFKNDKFKWKLFTEKEYQWVFRDSPCTICSSIYKALMGKVDDASKVLKMLYAQPYNFNRRLGEGITVFNPGDKPLRRSVLTNEMLQHRLDGLFKDSNRVHYIFSTFARTNNGIYALMDIKSHNTGRLIELHNIISEGVHKVEHIEENVHSLFLALMNPEDKKNIADIQSFLDRIQYIKIPYVLDIRTEVEIYRNIFGKHIDANFLPKVLHNFARVIISSRLKEKSEALLEWIIDPKKYALYCDKNLQLLKMEIYTGNIPAWLSEDDLRAFTAKVRKKIIGESEFEGERGFSGRDSIKIFHDFFSTYASEKKLITMSMLKGFFEKIAKEHPGLIPAGVLDSLCRMYNYNILQEVKEALYYYNQEKISADIQDYLFAINFEPGAAVKSVYTGKKLHISEDFFKSIETYLLGEKTDEKTRRSFRHDTQKEYTSETLTREIMIDNKPITKTELYDSLLERYTYNLKEKVLDPFLENENFRRGIKDYGTESFKTYDRRIKEDITYLITNLTDKFRYTEKGAKEVCIYVVDNDLPKQFART